MSNENTVDNTVDQTVAPWYRQPWFWFLLIFPTAAILWCTVMITVAINTENAMVTDDYSKQGKAINQELARDTRAVEMGLHAELGFSEEQIEVDLTSQAGDVSYPYLILQLFHPTLEERDRTIQLSPVSEHTYTARMPRDIDGRWYLDLRGPDNDWRLKGETHLPSSTTLELGTANEDNG